MNEKNKSGLVRDIIILAVIFMVSVVLLAIFPSKQQAVTKASWKFFLEMIWILPGVMVLMGLFMVWVPKEMVELQFLGSEFMAARLVLTILFVVIMGIFIEKIIEMNPEKLIKERK